MIRKVFGWVRDMYAFVARQRQNRCLPAGAIAHHGASPRRIIGWVQPFMYCIGHRF